MRMSDFFYLLKFNPSYSELKNYQSCLELPDINEQQRRKAIIARALIEALKKAGAVEIFEKKDAYSSYPMTAFLWEGWIKVGVVRGIPESPEDCKELDNLIRILEDLKELRAEDMIDVEVTSGGRVIMMETPPRQKKEQLRIPGALVKELQGKDPYDPLSFEDAVKLLRALRKKWQDMGFYSGEQKGWIVGERVKKWIWRMSCSLDIRVDPEDVEIPPDPYSVQRLEELLEALEEVKRKGAKDFLSIWAEDVEDKGREKSLKISWERDMLKIPKKVVEKALGKRIKTKKKKLSISQALKVLNWLLGEWKRLLEEAGQKGWIVGSQWIWNRYESAYFRDSFPEPKYFEEFKRIREALKKIGERGAEGFLEIGAEKDSGIFSEWIEWNGRKIKVSTMFISGFLKRLVEDGEPLSFSELQKAIEEIWKKVKKLDGKVKDYTYTPPGCRGDKKWIWERYYKVFLSEKMLPLSYESFRNLKLIKKWIGRLKELGLTDYLRIITKDVYDGLFWDGKYITFNSDWATKVLGREVGKFEELSLQDLERILEKLLKRARKFVREAEKRGWIEKDKEGKKAFFWEKEINAIAVPSSPKELSELGQIKKLLEALECLGFTPNVYVNEFNTFCWYWRWSKPSDAFFEVSRTLASKALGKELMNNDAINFEELKEVVRWLSEKLEELKGREDIVYVDKEGKKRFIWWQYLHAEVNENGISGALGEIKKVLEEIKKKGLEDFLWIEEDPLERRREISWEGNYLTVGQALLLEALRGGEIPNEWLSVDGVLKVVDYLLKKQK